MPKTLKKKTILVADDNQGIVASLSMALKYGGYEVTSIMNGNEVKKIQAPFPDLILLDIWMADVSGFDVCKSLKEREDTKDIPIVMISAFPGSDAGALQAGANAFLEKPYSLNDMLTVVGKHVS